MISPMDLKTLYQQLTPTQRRLLAAKVGINPTYLHHISTGWTRLKNGRVHRAKPSVQLIGKLVEADKRLTLKALLAEAMERPGEEQA